MSFNYNSVNCPVCGKPFNRDDDIVVCPECGAPHHRECYFNNGGCAFEAKHSEGFEWKKPVDKNVETINCPVCNEPNEKDKIFCEACGAPMHQVKNPSEVGSVFTQNPDDGSMPFTIYDNVDPNSEIDGIKVKHWQTYIGNSAPFYLYQFKRMDTTGKRNGICWSALLFPHFYFFYRRVWSYGAVAFVLNMLLSMPLAYVMASQIMGFTPAVSTALLENAVFIANIIRLAVNIFWGMYGTYIYRTSAAKAIKQLKSHSASEKEFEAWLSSHAGPSKAATIIIGAMLIFSVFSSISML